MSMKYDLKCEYIKSEVMKFHNDKAGWKNMKPHKNVEVACRPSPHFNGNIYKFECDVDLSADALFDVMKPPFSESDRLEWDKGIKDYNCLEKISDDKMVGVFVTHSVFGGLISSREFLDLYYFVTNDSPDDERFESISWIYAQAIEHEKRPLESGVVRGHNYPTAYAVGKLKSDPTKSRILMYVNCDIGGMIPQSLVERALPGEQVKYINNLQDETKRRLAIANQK